MSAQTKYGFTTVMGAAGGISDLAPYAVDTFSNESATGALAFGMGVVAGASAGKGIKLPSSTSDVFEGIVTNRRTQEHGLEGETYIRNKQALGVMRYGRIFALLADSVEPTYGAAAYLVVTGDDAGKFTTASAGALAVNARFLSGADNGIAEVELITKDVI